MHFNNDNEMNSSAININSNANNTISTPIPTPTPSPTATASSCTSSTDSGVIIIDNKRTLNSTCNNANNKNNSNNKHNPSHTCNGANETLQDNAHINGDNKEMRSDEKLHFSKNIDINDKSDKNKNINISNIINITKATSAQNHNVEINIEDNGRRSHSHSVNKPSSKAGSPTVSIRSTSISIVSIDENAIDSSIVDSDSDFEADAEGVHTNYTVRKLGQQTTYEPDNPNLPHINKGLTVINQSISPGLAPPTSGPLPESILNGGALCPAAIAGAAPNTPQIGSIALSNSTDVTFGDKHFYEGPVTIQQFLIDSRDKWKANEQEGQDNPTFAFDGKSTDQDGVFKTQCSASQQHQPYKFIFNRKAVIITSTIIVLTILIGIIIVTTNALLKPASTKSKLLGDGDDSRKHIPINSTIGEDNVGGGKILRIVARDGWLAQPPSKPPIPLNLPVHNVIVLPTFTDDCTTQAVCTYRVRMMQTLHIESFNHDDIIYNFLIGGDGNVYEGRGWNDMGAHVRGFNEDSISFAYIGTFKKIKPSQKQMDVTKLLLEEGLRLGKIAPDYKIVSAQKLDPTATITKAEELYNSFKDWPHWSE